MASPKKSKTPKASREKRSKGTEEDAEPSSSPGSGEEGAEDPGAERDEDLEASAVVEAEGEVVDDTELVKIGAKSHAPSSGAITRSGARMTQTCRVSSNFSLACRGNIGRLASLTRMLRLRPVIACL